MRRALFVEAQQLNIRTIFIADQRIMRSVWMAAAFNNAEAKPAIGFHSGIERVYGDDDMIDAENHAGIPFNRSRLIRSRHRPW